MHEKINRWGKVVIKKQFFIKNIKLNIQLWIIDRYKFDLRVYVVVTGTDQLQAFVAEEGLARFCTTKF